MMLSFIRSHFTRDMEPEHPESRSGHIATLWNNVMYVWGGYNDDESLLQQWHDTRTVWKYHIDHNKWSKHKVGGNCPSPRLGGCGGCIQGRLIVFGGCGRRSDLNDVHILHLKTLRWDEMKPTGALPSGRNKSACCVYEDRIIIFGGYGPRPDWDHIQNGDYHQDDSSLYYDRGWNNHLFAYDLKSNSWITLPNDGNKPSSRAAHAFTSVDNKAYLYGGRHLATRTNDFYMLCLDTYVWTRIYDTNLNGPIGRSWHSLTPISHKTLFLFGGLDTSRNVLSDGWLYNIDTGDWLKVRDDKYPRLWHTTCPGSYPGQVLVFAGCENNIFLYESKHSQSLLIFNLQPKPLLRICLELLAVHRKAWIGQREILPSDLYHMLDRLAGDGG